MSKKRPEDMLTHLANIKKQSPATAAPSAESANVAPVAGIAPSATGAIFKKHGVEIRVEYLEKLKDLAYWRRVRLRDLLDAALREYLEKPENEGRGEHHI